MMKYGPEHKIQEKSKHYPAPELNYFSLNIENTWANAKSHFSYFPNEVVYTDPKQNIFLHLSHGVRKKKKELGRGSYGEVSCYEDEFGRTEAVKMMSNLQDLKSLREMLNQDTTFTYSCLENSVYYNHPTYAMLSIQYKINGINGMAFLGNTLYFSIPLYDGENLANFIKENSHIDQSLRIKIARACTKEIQRMHNAGIIHCDIKPLNFIIKIESGNPILHIIDFDLSKFIERDQVEIIDSNSNFEPAPLSLGGINYFAPECKNAVFSRESDVFQLGLIFSELQINHPFVKCMTLSEPTLRPTIDNVIAFCDDLLGVLDGTKAFSDFPKIQYQEIARKNDNHSHKSEGNELYLAEKGAVWLAASYAISLPLGIPVIASAAGIALASSLYFGLNTDFSNKKQEMLKNIPHKSNKRNNNIFKNFRRKNVVTNVVLPKKFVTPYFEARKAKKDAATESNNFCQVPKEANVVRI